MATNGALLWSGEELLRVEHERLTSDYDALVVAHALLWQAAKAVVDDAACDDGNLDLESEVRVHLRALVELQRALHPG